MFRNVAFLAMGASALTVGTKDANSDLNQLIKSIRSDVPASFTKSRGMNEVEANLIAGAKAFNDATQAMTSSPEQEELTAALQAATFGNAPSAGVAGSTGAAFLQTQTPSKISLEKLNSIAAAVEASASKHVASGRASSSCGKCTPNFSACPSGFVSSGGVCSPTEDYSGYCNKSFSLGDFSPVELEEAEVFCDFCFPC